MGLSAGQICYGSAQMDCRYEAVITEAATILWERVMSAWVLSAVLRNGAAIWISLDGLRTTIVEVAGDVHIALTG